MFPIIKVFDVGSVMILVFCFCYNIELGEQKMKEGAKTYKFSFHAKIGQFILNAPNISSPLSATWKRSSQSVTTSVVEMIGGKADFNQTVTLVLNMYYDEAKQLFQQKKTLFTFTMQTPKGEKQAGVVYIEVASMLNNKVATLANVYPLEKCPVKDSKVNISVTAELIGEGAMSDTMSVDSTIFNQSAGPSTLSIESKKFIPENSKVKQEIKKEVLSQSIVQNKQEKQEKSKIVEELESQISRLTKQKESLSIQLQRERKIKEGSSESSKLRQQLLKSKKIQQKLQNQINNLRAQNTQHENELQKMRVRMEQIYELLFSNLNSLY